MPTSTRTAFLLLVVAQALHSIEEYFFRLYDVLAPARVVSGLVRIDRASGFVVVHVALFLFGLWCYFRRIAPGHPAARAYAWGWAVIEILNAFAHAALALAAGGYFPGLATAPLLLVADGFLASRLSQNAAS
jgi:hypothetical protein